MANGSMWDHISSRTVAFITTATARHSHWHGLHTLTAAPQLTQAFHSLSDGKTSTSFGVSNDNKWQWLMWQTYAPSQLAWSEGWQPSGGKSAFWIWIWINNRQNLRWSITWIERTLAMTTHDDSTINTGICTIGSRPSDYYFRSVCLFVCAEFFQPSLIRFGSN